MSQRILGYTYCALAMVTVGSTVVASKIIAAGLPPFTATALRFGIAFPILLLLMLLMRVPVPKPERRDRLLLLVQAGCGSVGYTVFLILGLNLTSAVDAGAITGAIPVVAAAVAVVTLRERLGLGMAMAIALATLGVGAVTLDGDLHPSAISPAAVLGNALVLAAIACEAIFILLNKKLDRPIDPLPLSTLMAGIGLALALVPALMEQPWASDIEPSAVLGTIYYAVVPTVAGFLLWYSGSRLISGAEAALMTSIAPLSAVLLAAVTLNETVGYAQAFGLVCVLGAVAASTVKGPAVVLEVGDERRRQGRIG